MTHPQIIRLILQILEDPRLGLGGPFPEDSREVRQLAAYLALWQKWNARINLTSEKDPQEFVKKHLFISLQYGQGLQDGQRVMDIGSGAGLPGIPLKICRPGLELVLVEGQRKRANFLATVVQELGLDLTVHGMRAEHLVGETAESFDAVLFRAVSDTADCLALAEPWLKTGGKALILKTNRNTANPLVHPYFKFPRAFPVYGFEGEEFQMVEYRKAG